MAFRKIVEIDQRKCNGCGLCVSVCAEAAIEVVNGKARLVSDTYCDGLGACLGECPQDAIRVVERDAAAFDDAAVQHRVRHPQPPAATSLPLAQGCPGASPRNFGLQIVAARTGSAHGSAESKRTCNEEHSEVQPSALSHWPIQLRLVPAGAAFLRGSDLLLVADCVPFALPDFHERYLAGRPVVIGCPKLDDGAAYVEKLAEILSVASLRSLTVIHMEVPCCTGLLRIAETARRIAGVGTPVHQVTISVQGKVRAESQPRMASQ